MYSYVHIYVCVYKYIHIYIYMDFPGGSVGKESACNAGSILRLGISSGEGTAIHYSILAWKIPWTEETGGTVHGISRVRHDLMTSPPPSPHTHIYI